MSRLEIKQQLVEVKPDQLEAYLVASGWLCDGELSNRASIWHRPEKRYNDAEVLLPKSQSAKDYKDRIVDAVFAIATFEERTPVEVAKAMIGFFTDQISVRVLHHDVTEGTIPLNDGVLLNLRARDLLAASAMSTLSKRKRFFGAPPLEARKFLESLRLGQTAVGSYIVNVIAPVKPIPSNQQSIPLTSMTRMVTANLSSSLNALNQAIEKFAQADDLTVFDSAVNGGASANMCDALLGLSGRKRTRGFEITITPSPSEAFEYAPSKFVFEVEKLELIASASKYYKDDYVLLNRTVSGYINKLVSLPTEEGGTITIDAKIGDTNKDITIELGPVDYYDAVTAHNAKEIVESHGDVYVKARTVKLLNQTDFRVVRSGDLFES